VSETTPNARTSDIAAGLPFVADHGLL